MFDATFKFCFVFIVSFFCALPTNGQECASPITVNPPGSNLQSLINNNPAGTCFYFPNGNYSFGNTVPKNNMVFEGESRSGVQINGNGFENAFSGIASNVTIKNVTLFNFNNNAGQPLQEQSPIRGADRIWATENDPLADGWVIDNIESHSNIASGIFIGNNFTVQNSIFRDNGVTGIGGDGVVGAYIYNNVIHHNGANQASGAQVNGGGLKIGSSGSITHPIEIRDNTLYENSDIGIWADLGCHYWEIVGNTISNHEKEGILYEISDNAIITSNVLIDNAASYSGMPGNWAKGGIGIAESAFVEVTDNRVTNSRAGIVVQQTFRPFGDCIPGQFCEREFFDLFDDLTLVSSDIMIRQNTIIGATEMGIANSESGFGQLNVNSNIQFICNDYDDPAIMDFYWIDGELLNYSQWQAVGRDLCSTTMPAGSSMCRRESGAVIDGIDDDWGLEVFDVSNVILGNVDSNADLSGQFEISWDSDFLYIYATIFDDQLIGDSTNPWDDDGLEVYIDGGNEKGTSYDANDHQFIFKLTDPNTVYYHSDDSVNPAGLEYALTSSPGVSYVELKIDLQMLIGITPVQGMDIGIDIHVNDDDDGGDRDSKLSWSAQSDNAWNNPSLFGSFTFENALCDNPCDQITNGTFDQNLDGWIEWNCDAVWENGVCRITNIQDVTVPWNAAVAFPDVLLRANAEYSLSFGLGTITSQRNVSVKVGKASPPYTSIMYTDVMTTPGMVSQTLDFNMVDTSIVDGRIEFQVGTDVTNLTLDNVSLIELYCQDGELCQDTIVVFDPISQSRYHARTQVKSSATVQQGIEVEFYAGNNIELNVDFTVESGAVFLADIQDCEE